MGEYITRVREEINDAFALGESISLDDLYNLFRNALPQKKDKEFPVYNKKKSALKRDISNDRVFPLDTVLASNYFSSNNTVFETPIVHIGDYADDLAFEMNALAVVIGYDIFFRGGKYQPETEEGRKIIAHELKHVEQYKEKRINKNIDNNILEDEAKISEKKEEYDPDPFEMYVVDDEIYWFRRSEINEINMEIADGIEEWVSDQKYILSEEEYLHLLEIYKKFLEEG